MKDKGRFEDIMGRDLDVRASAKTYNRLRDVVLNAHGHPRTTESAATRTIKHRTILRNPVARLAAAAIIALAILLPAGYAAIEAVVKYFTISENHVSFEIQETNYAAGSMASRNISVGGMDIATEDEARAGLEEFYQLYRAGKAREIQPGLWQVTLANGQLFNYKGDPRWVAPDFAAEQKSEFEEIDALRKAGKGERTPQGEAQMGGRTFRICQVRYILSSGKVVTVMEMANPDGSLAGMGGGDGGTSVP